MYGKQTETAIAAVSYLAELWRGPGTRRVSAADIADARGLQRPFVAKLLSALSQAGIVSGSPGPGGGYALAKNPAEIRLRDVWLVFERPEPQRECPFGGGQCGVDRKCALHQRIQQVHNAVDTLLDETTFDVFAVEGEEKPTPAPTGPLGGRLARLGSSNGSHGSNGTNGTNGTNGHHHASNGHG
jgi:Rrf2 family iron-sulfur cluster assembly transcriptional regulator